MSPLGWRTAERINASSGGVDPGPVAAGTARGALVPRVQELRDTP